MASEVVAQKSWTDVFSFFQMCLIKDLSGTPPCAQGCKVRPKQPMALSSVLMR